ncbi:hypothetical protein NLG97_g2576 [Lecanicillium saksenae]|uniref:Uncharacterized protein n=1 Tax=Lecanicillium saksenae TaxID=468837 RepID=A0ACC1R3Y8_9HYPO|nr:hypothetical protein NLG97_g2576 [Lecanicillium saksenae]
MSNQPVSRWSYSTESSQATKKSDRRESANSTESCYSANSGGIRRSIDSENYDGVEATAVAVPTSQLSGLLSSSQAVNDNRGGPDGSPVRTTQFAKAVRITKAEAKIVDVISKNEMKQEGKSGSKNDAADKNNASSSER